MFRIFNKLFLALDRFLHQPKKVLSVCLAIVLISLVFEGSLFQLWGLYRDHKSMITELSNIKDETKNLQMKIQRVSDPDYLKLEAQNRYDLAGEGDLIFVFTSEDGELNQ